MTSKFIVCDCHSHGLVAEKFDDHDGVYLSLFERGFNGGKLPFAERLRWCWQILRHGRPWTDLIVLNKEKQEDLCKFLSSK